MGTNSAARYFLSLFATVSLAFAPMSANAGTLGISASVPARYGISSALTMDSWFAFSPNQYFSADDGVVGHESVSRVILTNNGSGSVTIAAPSLLQGNFTARFDMLSPVTLAPSDTLELRVYVTPTAAGTISGTVRYGTSLTSEPYIDLAVTGTAIMLQ
jgi:hypothetical protein